MAHGWFYGPTSHPDLGKTPLYLALACMEHQENWSGYKESINKFNEMEILQRKLPWSQKNNISLMTKS